MVREGCWTPLETFSLRSRRRPGAPRSRPTRPWGAFAVLKDQRAVAHVRWPLLGAHNVMNALAAVAAAHHLGVTPDRAAEALARFRGVKRRMEVRGVVGGVTVYDDSRTIRPPSRPRSRDCAPVLRRRGSSPWSSPARTP